MLDSVLKEVLKHPQQTISIHTDRSRATWTIRGNLHVCLLGLRLANADCLSNDILDGIRRELQAWRLSILDEVSHEFAQSIQFLSKNADIALILLSFTEARFKSIDC